MMCVSSTPVDFRKEFELFVKHEELCCPTGPHFSKTRGVFAHAESRPEKLLGVLDTYHSQGGWAVAQACALLNKKCILFYPVRKSEDPNDIKPQQAAARDLGAQLVPLPAGRSAVLYHRAKHIAEEKGGYMFPNALKLIESVNETKREFCRTTEITNMENILIPASSGTIAAGVIAGAVHQGWEGRLIVHLGYSRPKDAMIRYLTNKSGGWRLSPYLSVEIVDQGYDYADAADIPAPDWGCNEYYDRKTLQWWADWKHDLSGPTLLWNIG